MIYTLTTNPAIDMNITTDGLVSKYVNRTYDTLFTPNGKGLNVSFVLSYFGVPSKITGFFGGFTGNYIVGESIKRGFVVHPIWIEETTRINIFLYDGKEEYKLVNQGANVIVQKQEEMLTFINNCMDMSELVISGSLPVGIDPNYYEKIFEISNRKKVKVILDISSKKLKDLLPYKPYLIKPNDEEIFDIFGIEIKSEKDIIDALLYLYNKGAMNVLLTLGEKGLYFYDGKHIYNASAQQVKLKSSACAGDAALGAFLSIYLANPNNVEEALKRASATGANVAESDGLGNFENIEKYMKNIIVRKVR